MAPMSEISPASRRSLGTRQRRLRRTTLPPAPHHKRNSRPGHVWSLTAAERKLAQQDLVIAVRDEPRQCRRGIKTVASIETKSVRVERRGADPEIARSELQRLLLKPSEDARADALTLGSRQDSARPRDQASQETAPWHRRDSSSPTRAASPQSRLQASRRAQARAPRGARGRAQ